MGRWKELDSMPTHQARIQDSEGGGVCSYIQKGGGGVVQEFQERIQIVAGPWANQQAKKKLQTAVGGGGVRSPPKKTCRPYPRLHMVGFLPQRIFEGGGDST